MSNLRGESPQNRRPPRVVVTGIGLCTPFGCGRELSWKRIVAGESATRMVDGEIGAPCPLRAEDATERDPVIELALRCAAEAFEVARLPLRELVRERTGCVIGTSKPLLRSFKRVRRTDCQSVRPITGLTTNEEKDGLAIRPTGHWPNEPSLAVARRFDLAGPCLCPVAACATGLVCVQRGVDLIRDGFCDAVLAGSSDASFLPMVLGSFRRLGVLARDFADPAGACRPFDRDRNGFVIGEGAAVFVLERLEDAVARGAKIYAEWLAGGLASDATSLTGLDPAGEPLARLIADVLRRGNVRPEEIDSINFHGTATRENDLYETRGLKRALGRAAFDANCFSIKGAIGHLLGAAGSVETAVTLLAIRDGVIPPTVNLRNPDPECDLNYTPRKPVRRPVRTALKLSLGFGGHLAAAVLRGVTRRVSEGSGWPR